MGIQGLLPLLKDIQVKTSISSYSGQTVGIDAYSWLHKGAYGCANDLIFNKPTKVYVGYVMRRIDMLIRHNVTPILVFDGGHLPAKADTEKVRRATKKKNRERGMAALKEGNTREANEMFQRCYDITPEMASEVIQECFSVNVQCIVAPYEADAQLAYLMKEGITQLTISEDSDLLLYGCNKVMYKMSSDGEGLVIDLANLSNVRTVQLASFTEEKFRHMCMLSGCDYLPSIKGMGLIKAFKSIRRFSTVFQCLKSLKCDRTYSVPKDYEENFRKADLVFKYQLVFDIRTKRLTRINEINNLDEFGDVEKHFAGPKIDDKKGLQIALGNVDPISGKVLANRKDFASGDISQKLQKSSSWDTPAPNKNTAFRFHGNSQQSSDITPRNSQTSNKPEEIIITDKPHVIVSSPQAKSPVIAPSPKVEADKSLKRLREDEVSVPTREEKIRKLYKEGEIETTDVSEETKNIEPPDKDVLAFVVHRHHNVFSNKSRKFKNPFKQINHDQSKKVVSRFFDNKIVQAKENTVLQVDTPPAGESISILSESTKTPQLEGSFLDYLDKTNLRGYEVKRLTLSPENTKQKKTKVCSPKKSKRKNIFTHCKNEIDKSVTCSPVIPAKDDNVDFNVTIPLDGSTFKEKSKKENNNLFNRFERKSKVDIYQEHLKRDTADNGLTCLGNDKLINDGKINIDDDDDDDMLESEVEKHSDMHMGIVVPDPSVSKNKVNICENKTVKLASTTNKRMNLKLGLSRSGSKGSLSSWSNMFNNSKCKTEGQVTEHSNSTELDTRYTKKSSGNKTFDEVVDDSECKSELKHCLENMEEVCCDKKTTDIDDQSTLTLVEDVDMQTDLLFNSGKSVETLVNNIDKDIDVEEDLLFSPGKDEIVELNEEPLPSSYIKCSENVETEKNNMDKVSQTVEIIYSDDEEPLPFYLDKNKHSDIVKNSALPTKIPSKKCKPIGLRRKRKCLDKTIISNEKLKQMTFDRFAFKKKSVQGCVTEDVMCLS